MKIAAQNTLYLKLINKPYLVSCLYYVYRNIHRILNLTLFSSRGKDKLSL